MNIPFWPNDPYQLRIGNLFLMAQMQNMVHAQQRTNQLLEQAASERWS